MGERRGLTFGGTGDKAKRIGPDRGRGRIEIRMGASPTVVYSRPIAV